VRPHHQEQYARDLLAVPVPDAAEQTDRRLVRRQLRAEEVARAAA